ncbi:MAG: glycosyltransferase family 4 protein [Cyclobacteriaceae bacterium]
MKAVLITNNFPPLKDGVGDHSWHLADGLCQVGYDVEVLSVANPKIKKESSKPAFKLSPIIRNFGISGILNLGKIIAGRKADVVLFQYVPYAYSQWGVPFPLIFLYGYLRFKGIKVLTIVHEPFIRFGAGFKYVGVALAQRLIALFIFGLSSALVTSIGLYKKMLTPFNHNIFQIPIGSNITPVTLTNDEKVRLRLQYALPDTYLIATFGNRDPTLLLDALRILVQNQHSVKVLFLGNNNKLDAKRKKGDYADLLPHLFTTGFLEPEPLFKLLLISDIFVLPENVDTKGRGGASLKSGSLAAAYSAGLPIISNRGDMTDACLKHKENIYFTDNDATDLANSIRNILDDHSLRNSLRVNALAFYKNYLSWDKALLSYEEIIKF